jgi:hypothetical protein
MHWNVVRISHFLIFIVVSVLQFEKIQRSCNALRVNARCLVVAAIAMMRIVPRTIYNTLFLLQTIVQSSDSFSLVSHLVSKEKSGWHRSIQRTFYSHQQNGLEDMIPTRAAAPSCSQRRRMLLYGPLIFPILAQASAASAADSSSQAADQRKLYQGYEQLNYLLDHWTEETTICGRSGDNPYISKNGCERTPLKVMDYLGYKDLNHPLFRAEKTMRRLEPYVPANREDDFFNAIENWMIAAEEGNGMAFVSSWGEANPGGGKDRVELFIERAKNNVIQARDSLATIVDILEIQKP